MPRALTIPIGAGSEPELVDPADAQEAIGFVDDFDEVPEPCDDSPRGYCEYTIADNYRRCIHCKRESGF